MPRRTTLQSIDAQIRALEAKKAALVQKPGIPQLKAIISKYKLTRQDVLSVLGKSPLKGKKVAPQYRDPSNKKDTWAGRGRQPRWLVAAIKAGKKREDFKI